MTQPQDVPPDDRYPTVVRVPPRCPECGTNRARCTGQSRGGLIRYHRCLSCGCKFRSVEIKPRDVQHG